jgi:hypothetical protein
MLYCDHMITTLPETYAILWSHDHNVATIKWLMEPSFISIISLTTYAPPSCGINLGLSISYTPKRTEEYVSCRDRTHKKIWLQRTLLDIKHIGGGLSRCHQYKMYTIIIHALRFYLSSYWGCESIVEGEESSSLDRLNSHAHKPLAHLLLRLKMHLYTKCYK